MRIRQILAFAALMLSWASVQAQTQVELGNGFKPWGSYDGSALDSVSLENGNLLLHAPIIPNYPQRGSLSPQILLYLSSHNWEAICASEDPMTATPTGCSWGHGGTGIWFKLVGGLYLQRVIDKTADPLAGC